MRLIDENKLIELTQKDMKYAFDNGFLDMAFEREHLIKVIRNQPTAYDVDKVVEQLEEVEKIMTSPVTEDCFGEECRASDCTVCLISKAIEIVKGGGVNVN